MDDAYLEKLYDETNALHRLDQLAASNQHLSSDQPDTSTAGKLPVDPIPPASIILLCSLAGIWVLMGVYVLFQHKKHKKIKI